MNISIIIPTYNHCDDFLKPCLQSVIKHTDLSDAEVIVVANGCTDDTKEYVESLGSPFRLIWIDEPSGYTKATNEGIKAATGEYVVLLNNDTILLEQPKNHWINVLKEPFENEDRIGITGPLPNWCPWARRHFIIFFCVMIKRKSFDEFGLLDEVFSPGFGEDTDFCIKMQDAGYKIKGVGDQYGSEKTAGPEGNYQIIGNFPIFHLGEGTFNDEYSHLLVKNRLLLMNRYNREIKLSIGSGKIDGYISVDLTNPEADFACDTRKLPIRDNIVEEIMAIDLLEHFRPQEVLDVLKEWFRVLKPGGKLVIEVPDIEEICKSFENANKIERYHLLDCIYSASEFPHRYGWYGETLEEHFWAAGFQDIVNVEPHFKHYNEKNIRMEAKKPLIRELPEGFFEDHDVNTYRNLIENVPDGGQIVELGCWKGRSLCSVADVILKKNISVVVVDTFAGNPDEDIKSIFLDNMKLFELNPRLLNMTAREASKQLENNTFDLVFIDTEDTFDAVREAMQDWWPKVKRGGVLAGHDIARKEVGDALYSEFGWLAHTNSFNIWWIEKHKVYDCFMFSHELDLLELRLNELDNEVDYFVLAEGTLTHSGLPKPLYFEENKARFSKFLHKIKHIVVNEWPANPDSPWDREKLQRDALVQGFADAKPYDVIMITDIDEIPRAEVVSKYKRHIGWTRFETNFCYYYLNNLSDVKWCKGDILSAFDLMGKTPSQIRYAEIDKKIPDAGWHFSFLGGMESVIEKIEGYAHQEYNTNEIKSNVAKAIAENKDIFNRPVTYSLVNIDNTYPKHVVENKEEYYKKGFIKMIIEEVEEVEKIVEDKIEDVSGDAMVTAYVSSKDRYYTTLPSTILSIIQQTVKPKRLILFLDGEHIDLRDNDLYASLFNMLMLNEIEWEVVFGAGKGQVLNHQKAIEMTKTDFLLRVDDDDFLQPNVLQELLGCMSPDVGAVGGLIIDPKLPVQPLPPNFDVTINNLTSNAQWFIHPKKNIIQVEHLNNSFLYRKKAATHGYCVDLSPAGHREETIFTYEMHRAGWKVLINPRAVTWHAKQNSGGIRAHATHNEYWVQDQQIFNRKLKEWGFKPKKLIVLDNGKGDHVMFKMILPEVREKFKDMDLVLGVCYPDVFEDEKGIKLISIGEAKELCFSTAQNFDNFNIYKFAAENNWKGSFVDAFRKLYLEVLA